MKLIIATIKPYKLDEVREALTEKGVRGMMVSEIKGFGAQSGHTEIYRGAEYTVNFVPKIRIELVVEAAQADDVVKTIHRHGAHWENWGRKNLCPRRGTNNSCAYRRNRRGRNLEGMRP